jgi:hypothetical protein
VTWLAKARVPEQLARMRASKAAKTATAPAGGDPHLHVLAVVAGHLVLVDVPGLRADDVLPGPVTSDHPKKPWCRAPSGVQ